MQMLVSHHLPGMQEVVLGTSEKWAVLLTATVRTPQKQLGCFQGLQSPQTLKATLMAVAEEKNRTSCREPQAGGDGSHSRIYIKEGLEAVELDRGSVRWKLSHTSCQAEKT